MHHPWPPTKPRRGLGSFLLRSVSSPSVKFSTSRQYFSIFHTNFILRNLTKLSSGFGCLSFRPAWPPDQARVTVKVTSSDQSSISTSTSRDHPTHHIEFSCTSIAPGCFQWSKRSHGAPLTGREGKTLTAPITTVVREFFLAAWTPKYCVIIPVLSRF